MNLNPKSIEAENESFQPTPSLTIAVICSWAELFAHTGAAVLHSAGFVFSPASAATHDFQPEGIRSHPAADD